MSKDNNHKSSDAKKKSSLNSANIIKTKKSENKMIDKNKKVSQGKDNNLNDKKLNDENLNSSDNKTVKKTLKLKIKKPKGLGRRESDQVFPSTIKDKAKHQISSLNSNADDDIPSDLVDAGFVLDNDGNKIEVLKKVKASSVKSQSPDEKDLFAPDDLRKVLIKMIKSLQLKYLKDEGDIDDYDKFDNEIRKHEKIIQAHLIKMQEQLICLDDEILYLYDSTLFSIQEKSLLRDIVTRVFGCHFYKSSAQKINRNKKTIFQPHALDDDNQIVVADAFALPVFGSAYSIHKFLDNKKAVLRLCDLLVNSGYISNASDVVAIMNIPLSAQSIYRPSVLNTISAAWGDLIVNKDDISNTLVEAIESDISSYLRPFEVKEGVCGLIIPGVRVFSGKASDYKALDEVLNNWSRVDTVQKTSLQSWWQSVTGHIVLEAQIEPGTLMIRPPAPPLVAQAQALAWHITHQVYDRLGPSPFTEINFISTSSNKLALRAYNSKNKIIAQSDPVSLFDVISASDDFASIITEECGSNGPRSKLREIIRTLDCNDKNFK